MIPYCGAAPVPGHLLSRWNLDPVLLAALAGAAAYHVRMLRPQQPLIAMSGWIIALIAFVSPICALSVALFSARIAQHMILMLFAAPLIARCLPSGRSEYSLWSSVSVFTVALWFWHMPAPYEATFRSTTIYWSMHLTLFGSAIWLWRDLLHHSSERTLGAISAGLFACVQMGLLGAVLTFSAHPCFAWYVNTTGPWGLSQLQDQQLGGVLMWVPGSAAFLAASTRSLLFMHFWLERPLAR